jgi:hypothetical protein
MSGAICNVVQYDDDTTSTFTGSGSLSVLVIASTERLKLATSLNDVVRSRSTRLLVHDHRSRPIGAFGCWRVMNNIAKRSARGNGGSRNSAASTTLNTDVVAETPSAIDKTAAKVSAGTRSRLRRAKRTSRISASSMAGSHALLWTKTNRALERARRNLRPTIAEAQAN